MGITTTLSIANLDYTMNMILVEWLSDSNCFGDPESELRIGNVVIGIIEYTGALNRPEINVEIIPIGIRSTGAGECGERKEFRTYNAHIRIITAKGSFKYAGDIGSIQLGDILMEYYRNATAGKVALAQAGLRKNRLNGGFPSNDGNYIYNDFYLTFEVLV